MRGAVSMPAIDGVLASSRTAGDWYASPRSSRRFHGRALPRPRAAPCGSGRKAARELQSIPGEDRIVHWRLPLTKGFLTRVCVLHIGKIKTRSLLFMLVPFNKWQAKVTASPRNRVRQSSTTVDMRISQPSRSLHRPSGAPSEPASFLADNAS
jgi:hypothetical protein